MISTRVGLSTASVYPEGVESTFRYAAELGYDGLEILVHSEPESQSADALTYLSDRHRVPIMAIHSPCLLFTAGVWSTDPLVKLSRSIDLAESVGAPTVVVHPPFVWQRDAAANFGESLAELQSRTTVRIAVENLYPQKRWGQSVSLYRPHWDATAGPGYPYYTLDLSHTAVSGSDAMHMADRMGSGLVHVHLTDGSGAMNDEHLVPGRGTQPCAELVSHVAAVTIADIIVEISTRVATREMRQADLAESLAFARRHLRGAPIKPA